MREENETLVCESVHVPPDSADAGNPVSKSLRVTLMIGRIVEVVARAPMLPPESSPVIASRVPPKDVLFQLRPQDDGIAVSGGAIAQAILSLCNDINTLNGAVTDVGTV